MLKLLRNSQYLLLPLSILSLLLGIFVVIQSGKEAVTFSSFYPHPLSGDFFKTLTKSAFVFWLIVAALAFTNGMYLNRLVTHFSLIKKRTEFTLFIYILFVLPAIGSDFILEILLSSLALIRIFWVLFVSSENNKISFRFVEIGFLLAAISVIIYFPLIFLFPFILFAQISLKHSSLREILFLIIGSAIPFLYLLAGLYLSDKNIEFYSVHADMLFDIKNALVLTKHQKFILLGYILLYVITSIFAIKEYGTMKVIHRQYHSLIFAYFLNILIVFLIINPNQNVYIALTAIPGTILFSLYFSLCRIINWNKVLFLIIIVSPYIWLWQ